MTSKFLFWLKGLIKKGDVHPFYISQSWRKARQLALEHYSYECQRCKNDKTPSVLTPATMVHHIKPLRKYPEYALSLYITDKETGQRVPQLIPLCDMCHAEVENFIKFPQKNEKKEDEKYPERW